MTDYVYKLERLLNEICPEHGDLFQGSLRREQCSIEVQTLILRVANPVVIATIRWPHIYDNFRIEASQELAQCRTHRPPSTSAKIVL